MYQKMNLCLQEKSEFYCPPVNSSKGFGNYKIQRKIEENLGEIIKQNFTLECFEVDLYYVIEKTKSII